MVFYIFLFVTLIVFLLQYLLSKNHNYWKKRKVPHLKPLPLFGNYKDTILLKKHQTLVTYDICKRFPNEPYIGTFFGTSPALIIQDPDLVKRVISTDFYYFSGREINDYTNREPITNNIFFTGGDKWKIVRQNLTPLFSSGKIKGMFPIIKSCANQLECLIGDEIKISPYLDAKLLLAKYTIDIITSCVFGINCNSMNKSEDASSNPFLVLRERIFDSSKVTGVKIYCRQMWPRIFYDLGFSVFDKSISYFFQNILTGVFKSREGKISSTNDIVDLILTLKKNKVITGDSLRNDKTGEKHLLTHEVNDEFLISQCVAMFGAGFETTSTTLALFLFEIAKNEDAQTKVIEEVDSYFRKNNSIEYECVNELPYIAACIDETLRLYPVLGTITREVMDDYTLPTGLRLQKRDRIHIPIYHIHRNPDYFPEPEEYRPERFYGDARNNIKPFTFLPFSEGPRICIGMRFSKMPLHAGILSIFKNYRVELAEDMPRSLPLQPYSFVTTSAIPIHLKFIPRKA